MEQYIPREEIEIDLREVFMILRKKFWVIILAGLGTGLLTFLICQFLVTDIYESTTAIYVLNKQDHTSLTYSDLQSGTQLTKDYKEIVMSRSVAEEVLEELGLSGEYTYKELQDLISVETPTDTRILKITAKHESPQMAQKIADQVRKAAADQIREVMDIESVNTIDPGEYPIEPSSPRVLLSTVLGILLGGCAAVFWILLLHILDDTIKTEEDVERYLGTGVLGILPVQNGTKKKKRSIWKRRKTGKAVK